MARDNSYNVGFPIDPVSGQPIGQNLFYLLNHLNNVVLTFDRVCDGKAVLYTLKDKRGLLARPSVVIDGST